MLRNPLHVVALGGGAGLLPAPGTWGTLVALPLYWGWLADLPVAWQGAAWLLAAPLCVGVAGFTARRLGSADPAAVVIDEIHAFVGVLIVLPAEFHWQLWAFLLFRAFDIFKPPPVSWADRRVGGGLGIMLDDWLASAMTLLLLALIARSIGLASAG
ncbi:MAG: phosphatidylglycerophosphatase A [Rhodocyclaceae bacterium]|nr:phosphatidylglycerophosphatase A [Rhodocyclaceae bacterium]